MKTIIRKAGKEDFDRIIDLFMQLWPGKSLNSDKLLNVFQRMKASDDYELLCAVKDDQLVGFASLAVLQNFWQEGLIMYITTMVVDQKHRGSGIGKSLIDRITEIAKEKGCAKIELESALHRVDAHSFYEKMGFEKRSWFFSKNVKSSGSSG